MKLKLIVVVLFISSTSLHSQLFDDIVETMIAPIVAPTKTTIDILKGDDPKAAIVSPWKPAGRVISRASDEFQSAQDIFMKIPRDAIKSNLGSDWANAYDILTASQRVQFELTTTSGRFLGRCLQGRSCGINELVAGPLAASLRDAYKVYYSYSYPLPPAVVNYLSTVMPRNIASSIRWCVGRVPNMTVPGFLNFGNSSAGRGHAVTIGNIIIFSEWPNLNTWEGWRWFLHEIHHYEQYMTFDRQNALVAIDGFSVAYIKNYSKMERDADHSANQRLAIMQRRW